MLYKFHHSQHRPAISKADNLPRPRNSKASKWMRLIKRDRNYARILFNLPLLHPVKKEVRLVAESFGYVWPETTSAESATESDQGVSERVLEDALGPPAP